MLKSIRVLGFKYIRAFEVFMSKKRMCSIPKKLFTFARISGIEWRVRNGLSFLLASDP